MPIQRVGLTFPIYLIAGELAEMDQDPVGESGAIEVRGFGGKFAKNQSDPARTNVLKDLSALHSDLATLEQQELEIWRKRNNGPLNSTLLFSQVEKRARSQGATEEDKHDYQSLKDLRAKQIDRENMVSSHTFPGAWTFAEPPPLSVDAGFKSSLDNTRFWAVVIGVDSYTHLKPLLGACSDAVSIYNHLTADLKVPKDRIRLLLSPAADTTPELDPHVVATRSNMLSALYDHLRDNSNVRKGDNILVYFAGHGASYDASSIFQDTEDTIEALCPADRGTRTDEGTILDISDRELSIFLEELCAEKGDRITVVLDCCHAGGATRADVPENVRNAPPLPQELARDMLDSADKDPRRRSGSRLAHDSAWEWNEGTCVLLASCAPQELSKEGKFPDGSWHGYFTSALLAVLRTNVSSGATYAEVCEALKQYIPMVGERYVQLPMVVGMRANSPLWFAQSGSYTIAATVHRFMSRFVSTAARVWQGIFSWLY